MTLSAKRVCNYIFGLLSVLLLAACGGQVGDDLNVEVAAEFVEAVRENLQAVIDAQAEEIYRLQVLLAEIEEAADVEINPIDRFFDEIAEELEGLHQSTHSMVIHGVLIATAWRAEVEHLQDVLESMTWNYFAGETIRDMVYHHRKYTQHHADLWAITAGSDAFDNRRDSGGNDNLFYGTIARVVRMGTIANGYRELALELLGMVNVVTPGNNQDFSGLVFDEDAFRAWMKEEFPWLWGE